MIQEGVSIYLQIARQIEEDILAGLLPEESAVPSTNRMASHYTINPATALKGVNLLVEEGILYKKRGLGMFVCSGAQARILEKRKTIFFKTQLPDLLSQARTLGIGTEELCAAIAAAEKKEG